MPKPIDDKPASVVVNRKKYIGGSDLPNILGLNETKYNEPIFEFAKKKMKLIPNDFEGNPYTKYGNLIEPIVRDYLNEHNGVHYIEDSIIDEDRRLRGNTDGIDRDTDSIPMLEVKTFGKSGLDVAYYTAQCQFYLETFDQPAIALVGYRRPDDFYSGIDYDLENDDEFFDTSFDPKNLEMHIIERDETMWAFIYSRIVAFQSACEALVAKPDMTLDEWNTLFYGADIVAQQNHVIELERQIVTAKEAIKNYDDQKKKLQAQFEKYGVKTLDTGVVRITHVKTEASEKKVIDEKKFEKEHPDEFAVYKKHFTKVKKTAGKSYLLIGVKELGGKKA